MQTNEVQDKLPVLLQYSVKDYILRWERGSFLTQNSAGTPRVPVLRYTFSAYHIKNKTTCHIKSEITEAAFTKLPFVTVCGK
jgi:hypothetical protein